MKPRNLSLALIVLTVISGAIAQRTLAEEVTIRIVGAGPGALYIEQGESEQRPVNVDVGDTVVWVNDGNLTHTATAETENGDLLFDTAEIRATGQSEPIPVTEALFTDAGGKPGGSALIDYFCDFHPQMQSSLVVSDAGHARRLRRPLRSRAVAARLAVRTRRDITSLSRAELNQYRDAWRRAQRSAEYLDLTGYHDCPRGFCHGPDHATTFLAWHREYILRLEEAVGEPLHYWDWTSSASASTGIPPAFSDSVYVSLDGNTYPNPLRSFRFTCPASFPTQSTSRMPDHPSFLASLASGVLRAYRFRTYRRFNVAIDGPHGGLHVWVGGHMQNTTYAAYDPIFWAHHSNVDRQWASWQRGGGPDPTSSELSFPLTGFPGRTVNHVKSIAPLGYAYDRYDPMPAGTFDTFVFAEPAAENRAAAARADNRASPPTAGVGKTFALPAAPLAAAAEAAVGPPELYVGGIPDHPDKSYFVYVFVNQPLATPEDATPDNPHFAGVFGVFGTGRAVQEPAAADRMKPPLKRVLQLFAGKKTRPREPISEITLVVTGEGRAVVARDDIPFDAVSVRPADEPQRDAAPEARQLNRAAEEFTGTSDKESYDEAYQAAVDQAEAKLTAQMPDSIIGVEVLSVTGRRGGFAPLRKLTVTIRAWLE